MKFRLTHQLRSSSLVEVLISMVILLLVFGIGLMIFTNLVRSSKSKQSKLITDQMTALAQQILDENSVEQVQKGDIYYSVEQEVLPDYSDRIRVKITAQLADNGKIVDSLIMIKERQHAN